MTTSTYTVNVENVDGIGTVPIEVADRGTGRPFLLLHGGGGPLTVAGFAERFAGSGPARVLTPTHPGFSGTDRPTALASPGGLAAVYVALLDELDLDDVTVVGNSIGGWVAAEMALIDSPRIGRVVLVDAVGIDVPGHPVADFFALPLPQIADLSYHEPDRYRIDPAAMSEAQRAAMATNRAALAVYAPTMTDPTLAERLAKVALPMLVVWGEADRIVDPDYGRAFAAAIPGARFELMTETGHLPQLETPHRLAEQLWTFVNAPLSRPPSGPGYAANSHT